MKPSKNFPKSFKIDKTEGSTTFKSNSFIPKGTKLFYFNGVFINKNLSDNCIQVR